MSRQEFENDYVEFLLGTLDNSRADALGAHLKVCRECRLELAKLREVLHSLPLGLYEEPPPAHLKERLMAQVAKTSFSEDVDSGPQFWKLGAIAASLIALVGLGAAAYLVRENRLLQADLIALNQEVETLRSVNQGQIREIQDLTAPNIRFINLAGLEDFRDSAGSAFLAPDQARGVLFLHNLPSLTTNQVFQLWLIEPDQPPHPAEVFSASGNVTRIPITLAISLDRIQTLAITIEPPGGSPSPTGPMVLAGGA